MPKPKRPYRFWRRLARVLAAFIGLIVLLFLYLVWVSQVNPPDVQDKKSLSWQRQQPDSGLYTIGNSWLRHSSSGLYEMYVEGAPFERGVVNGKLSKELVQSQEDYFTAQINKMIPSHFYRQFLKYFIGFFNRKLVKNVIPEYKEEIYGVSQSASANYGYIGTPYQRILNYHSAHDIGHALQNLALVGCTSFGTWGSASADSTMIIGRNFDFYVGDDFARNKIVEFVNPSAGFKFMSVTWGGFVGVVSGMNEKGLTVTINAAKSDLPTGSATPVSLVAREILQYAGNIQQAVEVARRRKMFVSESFLVGSAADNKAVIIEKTPDSLEVYDPGRNSILCTNHFQSKGLGASSMNRQQERESASVYRYHRLTELLSGNGPNTVAKTVSILRDQKGIGGTDIGTGNEKAVNQLIAHHSIVFEPQKLLVWVSTSPWQLGSYVAYDLKKVFSLAGMKKNQEISEAILTIPADSFMQTAQFKNFERFRVLKQRVMDGQTVNPDSLVILNPSYYHAYILAGDYLYKQKNYQRALNYYQQALTKEIATVPEKKHAEDRIEACKKRLAK
ncbi:MAG: peptidase C45 [Sphingobacteriales bacterium SCN 48-20]|uniref:C45 family autoproteolytic acyltransferase/hydolase n=1 Tax=Terrimonas ferruginea TaxID=249 RepID=UPI00086838F1|nr:C45 family autoproteolytic acyltransferase/hydolase [Terrimonas ferruginea]MBN8784513.1 peptidase C45 [Terrimonas ferruginea]ODT94683.1 MAG: peptidase C45 [Sphingobacteriales bacterium SCN 48-20]OJW40541.1 MAG: peptidase C45 [Sphingobacteriales bacterium 48-107]